MSAGKPDHDAYRWIPGSGNAPAGYHFENLHEKAFVVRDGFAIGEVRCSCVHAPEQHYMRPGCSVLGCECCWGGK